MATEQIDAALAAIGWNTTKVGTGTTLLGWALSSEGTAAIGIVLGVVGLAVQFYFNRRRDKREQAEHERRMARE